MHVAGVVLPPVIMLALLGLVWEMLCSSPDATLPPPSKVVADTWELITQPFYDNGGNDKGLFWHLLASLKRVALGYTFAAAAGIALGVLIGSSKWAMRALDPLFQVLRTIPPLAWLPLSLAAFRDGQPSAIFVIFITAIWPIIINTAVGIRNILQDYRNVARVLRLNGAEFVRHFKDSCISDCCGTDGFGGWHACLDHIAEFTCILPMRANPAVRTKRDPYATFVRTREGALDLWSYFKRFGHDQRVEVPFLLCLFSNELAG